MVTKQRSVTRVFREAQRGQLLEHVSLIQQLELGRGEPGRGRG